MNVWTYMHICAYRSRHICVCVYTHKCTWYWMHRLCLLLSKVKVNGVPTFEMTSNDPCLLIHSIPDKYSLPMRIGGHLMTFFQPINYGQFDGCHFCDHITKICEVHPTSKLCTTFSVCILWWSKLPCWKGPNGQELRDVNDPSPPRKWIWSIWTAWNKLLPQWWRWI